MSPWLQRLSDFEAPYCTAWNRRGRQRWLRATFKLVSRLGDGMIWYLTVALLPLSYGTSGALASLHMVIVGVISLALYRAIKNNTHRPRPCNHLCQVENLMPALDEFSFPSGHTLHAVGFTLVIAYHFPTLALFFGIFTLLVAISRLVLGLHYPSDVAAGALLGSSLAGLSILVI